MKKAFLCEIVFHANMEISQLSVAKIGLKSTEPSVDDYREVGAKLKEAFSKLGFVYILDHGIDEDLVER